MSAVASSWQLYHDTRCVFKRALRDSVSAVLTKAYDGNEPLVYCQFPQTSELMNMFEKCTP